MERKLEKTLVDNLITSNLWENCLKQDCLKQKVFLTIRKNSLGFYHKGGRLFKFAHNEFETHFKYASVIAENSNDYITEGELSKFKLISDFSVNYKRIKENCARYSGVESLGVSEIYHKYSYLSKENIVVLDIEVSFESNKGKDGPKQDRIDILLFNKETRTLKFIEAKHYSNPEIWSTGTPEVIGQIKRYEDQIKQKKETEIIPAFNEYVTRINEIFGSSLPYPIDV
jgi:hypothetical protein